MAKRLEGKCAVVTGAGGGIGGATAKMFAEEGAKVVCCDVNYEAVAQVAAEINETFPNAAVALKADVSNPADVRKTVDTCVKQFGKIDVYFANAGVLGKFIPISQESDESFLRTLQINTMGPFFAIKYASQAMKETAGGGSIILTSSIASIRADITPLQYAASKGALNSLTVAANDRLLLDRVRVNTILPGGVMTNVMMGVARDLDEQGLVLKGFDHERYVTAQPEEIAKIVVFLASDDSIVIKGATIVADGGMSNSMGSQPLPQKKTSAKQKNMPPTVGAGAKKSSSSKL